MDHRSVRQFYSVSMFLVALVLFCKNLFEPACLFFGNPLIRECRIVTNDKFLAATVTPERSHFPQVGCFLSYLPFLYSPGLHLLSFSNGMTDSTSDHSNPIQFPLSKSRGTMGTLGSALQQLGEERKQL